MAGGLDDTLKENDTLDDILADKILEVIQENPGKTQAEIAQCINTSVRTVKRLMKRLTEREIVVRVGGKRFGKWEIRR